MIANLLKKLSGNFEVFVRNIEKARIISKRIFPFEKQLLPERKLSIIFELDTSLVIFIVMYFKRHEEYDGSQGREICKILREAVAKPKLSVK